MPLYANTENNFIVTPALVIQVECGGFSILAWLCFEIGLQFDHA